MSDMPWFEKAIRDHCDEHGPSGGAWNISMILERLHREAIGNTRITPGSDLRDALELVRARAKQRPSDGLIERQGISEDAIRYGQALLSAMADEIERALTPTQCSFCNSAATDMRSGESDIFNVCRHCGEAWDANPEFLTDKDRAALTKDDHGGGQKGSGGISGSTSLRSPEPVPVSALTGNDPGRKETESLRERGEAKNLPASDK